MGVRILDFADGFTSASAPSITFGEVDSYANDAAYESAYGSPTGGEVYHNTTSNTIRTYIDGAWREVSVFEA